MKITRKIPREKINQFHEILCCTGGRYLKNPELFSDYFFVYYEPGDYKKEIELWNQCTTEIQEKFKNQIWRIIIRRLKLMLKVLTWKK